MAVKECMSFRKDKTLQQKYESCKGCSLLVECWKANGLPLRNVIKQCPQCKGELIQFSHDEKGLKNIHCVDCGHVIYKRP